MSWDHVEQYALIRANFIVRLQQSPAALRNYSCGAIGTLALNQRVNKGWFAYQQFRCAVQLGFPIQIGWNILMQVTKHVFLVSYIQFSKAFDTVITQSLSHPKKSPIGKPVANSHGQNHFLRLTRKQLGQWQFYPVSI